MDESGAKCGGRWNFIRILHMFSSSFHSFLRPFFGRSPTVGRHTDLRTCEKVKFEHKMANECWAKLSVFVMQMLKNSFEAKKMDSTQGSHTFQTSQCLHF